MNKDKVISAPFSYVLAGTGLTNVSPIQPNSLSTRIVGMADGFDFYRVTKLEFRLVVSTTSATASRASTQGVCYLGGVTDTAPANYSQLGEVIDHVMLGNSATVNTEWCRVSKRTLAGYNPWYKTVLGSLDPATEIQGNLFIINGTAADTYLLEVRGVIQFKGSAPPSSTPMMRQLVEMRREKDRLLKILAVTPPAGKASESQIISSRLP